MDAKQLIRLLREALEGNDEGAVVIDYAHKKVHEGDLYLASGYFANIANAGTVKLLLVTGAIPVHLTGQILAGGEAYIEFYEGATANPLGTVVTGINLNRGSTNTANLKLYHTPTVAGGSEGTKIYDSFAPAGRGPQAGGGDLRPGSEFLLAVNTTYYMVITNVSGNAKNYGVELEYYEELE